VITKPFTPNYGGKVFVITRICDPVGAATLRMGLWGAEEEWEAALGLPETRPSGTPARNAHLIG
jgi:hypothetical protein